MFTQLYGLQTTPFTRTLNTGDILATASVKELHARLALTVRERGIALVTGEVGSGKSTAVRAFLAALDPNRHTLLHLTLPMTSPSALYRQMLMALNQPIPFGATAQATTLRAVLADLIQTHRKTPVVVIDEAHLLGQHLIDPLRTLISAQLDSQSLAALILIGQPELRRTLLLSTHAAFAQRITHRCHMEPLPLEATLAYIQHHLKVAGLKDGAPLFSDDALKRIADWAQGIPRRINQICTAALIAGAVAKTKVIDDTPVRQAINDLERE
jgi:type II secretory pathway predicted ATPase ExeA